MHGRYGFLPAIDWPLLPVSSFVQLVTQEFTAGERRATWGSSLEETDANNGICRHSRPRACTKHKQSTSTSCELGLVSLVTF